MRSRILTTRLMAVAAPLAIIVAALAAPTAAGASTASGTATDTAGSAAAAAGIHRSVVYYQTQYRDGQYVSPKPLVDRGTGITQLIVGAIHINETPGATTLNDDAPSSAHYDQMWSDVAAMQSAGVQVIGMVGGAAPGTFTRLDSQFDTYYPELAKVVRDHRLDGLDLDVEESMSLAGIERLIDRLRADFGQDFVITLTPVAAAMTGGGNLSGFDYRQLEASRGSSIDWYNVQFYCGWGSLSSPAGYESIVRAGVFPASKLVAGTLTDPSLCGSGYVPIDQLESTIRSLTAEYGDFGGVFGWEYFTSQPGGTAAPWEWAARVSAAMG